VGPVELWIQQEHQFDLLASKRRNRFSVEVTTSLSRPGAVPPPVCGRWPTVGGERRALLARQAHFFNVLAEFVGPKVRA